MRRLTQTVKSNRILCIQILFVILAFTAMTVFSYAFMSSAVHGNLVRSSYATLDVTETRVMANLQEFKGALEGFADEARGIILREGTAAALRECIDDTSRFSFLDGKSTSGVQDFYGYFETLPGGPVMIQSYRKPQRGDFKPEEHGWYRSAVEAGGDIVATTPHICGTGEWLYTYAKSIFDEEGRRLGVVCLDVKIDFLKDAVVGTALNQGGYGMLINQDWMMMFHPYADFVGMKLNDPVIPAAVFFDDLRLGKEVFEKPMISYTNEEVLTFFRRLPNGWHLGLLTPKEQYYQSITNMAVIVSLLGVTFAAVLVTILIRVDAARAKSDDENRKKSMFLANMSHEIRTPINAIVGMSVIGKIAGTIERKDYCFSKIDNASKHLLGVINDILDMSKIEANKIEISPIDFNFEKMLQQVVNVVTFRLDEKRQKLAVHIDKAIPKVLFADDQRLAQVLTNLLGNAVKFTPEEGMISLKATLLDEDNGACTLKIEVTDTGIGISPEQQAKLFQSFQQAETSTTRKYGGSGLGLAISKSIVELMGGSIGVTSKLGSGTTFYFTVKVNRGDDAIFDHAYRSINWKNIRILTVDDDPDILMYFQDVMAGFGAHCDVALNAEEALSLIGQNGAYNIYFVDLKMPGIDGITLTKQIRDKEEHPGHSIVIMISSADLSAVEGDAKKAGVNKFLLKPLFPSAIVDVISECLGMVQDDIGKISLDISGIFEGRHILLVEDMEINCEIVLSLLDPTSVKIDCAENGFEAVKMFKEAPGKYDMIFMDVQMPGMDGYEASKKIRKLGYPEAKTIPIIAMTANVFKEDITACFAAGMNSHVGKPLDMNDLIETMLKYLGNSKKMSVPFS